MSNHEGMYSVDFKKKAERSESILRNSLFDILRFCGLLFKINPAIDAEDSIAMETSTCRVSYERRRWPRASSLIRKETNARRTSNVECINPFKFKKIEQSDSTLRHSLFVIRYSAVRFLI